MKMIPDLLGLVAIRLSAWKELAQNLVDDYESLNGRNLLNPDNVARPSFL
jgi:hypothetical protein